jgi:hypothetical protein
MDIEVEVVSRACPTIRRGYASPQLVRAAGLLEVRRPGEVDFVVNGTKR